MCEARFEKGQAMAFINWHDAPPISTARRSLAAIAWTVFFVALGFALDFNLFARQRLAEVEDSRVAFDRRSLESKQLDALHALVVGAVTVSASANGFYRDHLASLEESDRVPADLLASGAQVVAEARLRLATAEGGIAGVFANDPLPPEAVGLRSRLGRISTSMGILDSFFKNYLALGPAPAIRELRDADTWIGVDAVDSLASRLLARDENTAATARVSSAESEHDASWSWFLMRLWMSAIAVVYCVALLAVTFHSRWHLAEPHPGAA